MAYVNIEDKRAYSRAYNLRKYQADPEYFSRRNRATRERDPKRYMMDRARIRARSIGLPFTIVADDFEIPEFCPVFPLLRLTNVSGRNRPDNIATLDRILPALGYVPGNVMVISMRANRLKSDATMAELRAIADYIEAFAPK